jgi:glycosyltransferase involved in cell wall biosynthesis
MTDRPSVSVITPSYNQARFIEDTLTSVRRQSYEQVEHIVVDGDSDDGTTAILESHDESLTWISEPDEGQSDAINKGFDMADGDIVGWLNSDDVYFDTGVLDRVVSYFEQTGADVVYGDVALIDAESQVLNIHTVPEFDYDKLLRYCFIEQPSLFFRSEVLEENRLDTDLAYVMDYEFWLRLAAEWEFRHVPDVLSGDRNHKARKILNDRDQMQAEGKEMKRQYGGRDHRSLGRQVDRVRDVLTSGLPRRLTAIRRTLTVHDETPDLAFDGELCPRSEMLLNVFRPNRSLL